MLAWPVTAQTQPETADQETTRRLLERVDELERQVRVLRQAAEPTPLADSALPDDPPQSDHGSHTTDLTSPETRVSPLAEIHWFGDVGFRASDQLGETASFALGQLDLFLTSNLTDHLNILSELVFKAGNDNRYVINAERLLLKYTPGSYLTVGVGRYHTGIGFYNTAYHHGSWFETAVTRPTIFAYRGGLIPIHDIGVSASGRLPTGRLGLNYVFEVGNGQSSQSTAAEPTQNLIDENDGKAVNVGIFAKPEILSGLQVGFSTHRDRLHPPNAPAINQTTFAVHAVYLNQAFEWLNEAVAVRSARLMPASDSVTRGFYSQVSREFASARPYFRYQYVDANDADAAFRALGHRYGPTIGLRYDLGKFAAVKAQYERTVRRGLPTVNGFASQLAFTF
ncbi:MAG: hypothetical protein DMF92_02815 [Acidobacteria bacterium]|nr:MAG: hypothetical protein DMF92_02815 [Acidobacteriota bacterium]